MSADILMFPGSPSAIRAEMIAQARANYDSIFPADTTTSVLPTPQDRNRERLSLIKRRDDFKFRGSDGKRDICDDLRMDHADNGMPSDAPYHARDAEPA